VVKKEIQHEQYRETLFKRKQFWRGINILRSNGHEIYSMRVDKVSLSAFDTKRWKEEDDVHTLAYGHKKIRHGLVREEAEYSDAQPIALHEQNRT